jgi:hypothetical protein
MRLSSTLAIQILAFVLAGQLSFARAQSNSEGLARVTDTGGAFSPETQAAVDQKFESYRLSIEERARHVLDREFLRGRALLIVRLRPNLEALKRAASSGGIVNLTTLPNSVSRGKLEKLFVDNIPISSMKEYVRSMSIDVTVDRNIPPAQQELAQKLLEGSLNLPRGAKIQIQTADISTKSFSEELARAEKGRQDAEIQRQRLADDAARADREKEAVAADKRSAEIALRQEQQKNLILSQELEDLKSRLNAYEEEINIYKTPLGDIKKLIKGLELPLTVLPIFVVLLGVLVVFAFIFNATARRKANILRESVEVISGSVQKLGNRLQQRSGDSVTLNASARRDENDALLSVASNAQSLPAGGDFLAEEAVSLRRDAEVAWRECWNHRFHTLCELREWLANGNEGRQRFLSLVSALPPSDAAQILGSFAPQEMRQLKDLVVDLGSKFMGYSLILSLHRAVVGSMAAAPHFLGKVDAPQLIKASDSALANALISRAPDEQTTMLRILPVSRRTRVLEAIAEKVSTETVASIFAGLCEARVVDESSQLSLLAEMEKLLESAGDDGHGSQQMALLDDLVEQMDGFSPRLKAALHLAQRQNPELAEDLRARTITFDNVLLLDNSLLQELIEPLDSEQIAQILLALDGEQQNRLGALIHGRLRDTVVADMQRLAASPAAQRKNAALGRKLQGDLVDRLLTMANQGLAEIPRSAKRSA